MFLSHFSMNAMPFSERTSVSQILKDERFTQYLARLTFFAHHANIALVTGPTGVGKSTLIKFFFEQINHAIFHPAYLHLTHLRSSSLMKLVAAAIGENPKFTKERVFTQILDKTKNADKTFIIVFDEAHLLSQDALTDIRLLLSSATDEHPPFKLLLVGQDSLLNLLQQDTLLDLFHRINVRCQLKPLTKAQTHSYIDFQLKSVSATPNIFDSQVKDAIFDYSHGIPRQINNIATACLIHAVSLGTQSINHSLFSQAINEFSIY